MDDINFNFLIMTLIVFTPGPGYLSSRSMMSGDIEEDLYTLNTKLVPMFTIDD